ncbi:hypothetical protein F3Y22_tig00001104pilonHSYRG00022 [Hibiscus syriacus]|uniref:Protein FAR1-RELATED SEQUENCE n=1 Tax=Hibiscus syriacus TaxID=106335 RepID=A0A6A3CZC5_HIBSY|nr:hypothetical protein F3Y22_tig00001104pilonHSYRG00022 [Hibiscus syriacus]
MDNTDVDNVKPTEECHEVHNVDESDRLVGQLFCSHDQAWHFYKGFAREHGFSARKGTHGLTWKGCEDTEFCCSKEGFQVSKVNTVDRQRAHTPVTRTGCKARVVVTATNTNDQWVISKSDQKHNHALCTSAMTPFMRSNRAVSKADIDEATTLKEVDESGALYNLIWSDSTSRSDYTCFGDVIAFDTTYKDNLYGRPIVPIVGVNHHHNTIVFATAIIADETSQSFEWVLHNFLEAMMKITYFCCNRWDRAMQRAINLLSLMLSTDYVLGIFLAMHKLTLVTQSLQQHSQNAWLPGGQPRNLIFNGVRLFQNSTSTSIHGCESMNASLAIALKHKKTYLDVVRAIEDGISRMRMNELKADYLSSHTKPFRSQNWSTLKAMPLRFLPANLFVCSKMNLYGRHCTGLRQRLSPYQMNTVGLPCRHQLHILKQLDYTYLPGTLIQSRWTNDAKASAPSYVDLNVSPEVMQMARLAALRSTSSRLCYIASKTDESFKTARDEMKKLIEELENSFGLNHSVN